MLQIRTSKFERQQPKRNQKTIHRGPHAEYFTEEVSRRAWKLQCVRHRELWNARRGAARRCSSGEVAAATAAAAASAVATVLEVAVQGWRADDAVPSRRTHTHTHTNMHSVAHKHTRIPASARINEEDHQPDLPTSWQDARTTSESLNIPRRKFTSNLSVTGDARSSHRGGGR